MIHDLRHFMATQMLAHGVAVVTVSQRLGHARASTTLNVYGHCIPGADRRPLAHRYFGPELGDAYVASTDGDGNLKFSMRPSRWWSVDYTKS